MGHHSARHMPAVRPGGSKASSQDRPGNETRPCRKAIRRGTRCAVRRKGEHLFPGEGLRRQAGLEAAGGLRCLTTRNPSRAMGFGVRMKAETRCLERGKVVSVALSLDSGGPLSEEGLEPHHE